MNNTRMQTPNVFALERFNFDLPPEQIAVRPPDEHGASRLLVIDRHQGSIQHATFQELPTFLQPKDLLIANNSPVAPCRLNFVVHGTDKTVEGLLMTIASEDTSADAKSQPASSIRSTWLLLAKKTKPGQQLILPTKSDIKDIVCEVGARQDDGSCLLHIHASQQDVMAYLQARGLMPLPPYILKRRQQMGWREQQQASNDRQRYQTVFAQTQEPSGKNDHDNTDWSVAAPTAGLHFTQAMISKLHQADIGFECLTHHVGRATFAPIKCEDVRAHKLGAEWFAVPPQVEQAIDKRHGRLVAVGTTVVRALESAAAFGKASGWTDLYIYPGYKFQRVEALLTNFHLPGSTLLLLVMAFAGEEITRKAYAQAVDRGYRFYSYGDAMLIL